MSCIYPATFAHLGTLKLSCTSRLRPVFRCELASNRAAIDPIQMSAYANGKIREMLNKVEIRISAYDTAWVAMAPSPTSPSTPCFPGTLDWILDNQRHDGSWGLSDSVPMLVKETLSSTLACILALKKWGVGEEHIRKGLDFIVSNFASAVDERLISPIGFDVIFPSMTEKAVEMGVNLHLSQADIDAVLQKKGSELKRIQGKNSKARDFYFAHVAEALDKSQDWRKIMTYQKKNGSLLNSPSTTAAAFIELQDPRCHSYLCSVLEQFGDAVPTLYPADAYFRLYKVDSLEKLGIDRHFKEYISSVLNETFRQWERGCEEIFGDYITCAMAFRLLRHHGYDVSSEPLAVFHNNYGCFDLYGGNFEDIQAALEVFRASQLKIYAKESYLDKLASESRQFLEHQLSHHLTQAESLSKHLIQEVAWTLKSPYNASLERLASRNHIECFDLDRTRMLKSSICWANSLKRDLLNLAKIDFNSCQSIHVQEFKQLQRWVSETRLNQLTFSRQKLGYCYFSAAATLYSPELADARISWAKNGVLTTVVDDFFDVGSSEEEQLNLIQLFEEWDANGTTQSCSDKVHIVFSALKSTICEIGDKACAWQDRNVTDHIVEIWLSLIKSMWIEAEMTRRKSVPTIEQYIQNAYVSFALGPIVLPALYFIGPKLSENIVRSADYQKLFELMSTCGRLLNDIQGFQREAEDGKLNAVSLSLIHDKGSICEEDAIRELRHMVEDRRHELLRLVLQGNDSMVPRECRDVFWKMSKVLHLFYMKDDGFTSDELKGSVKSILHDPINY